MVRNYALRGSGWRNMVAATCCEGGPVVRSGCAVPPHNDEERLIMSDLVQRLARGRHRLVYSRAGSSSDLRQAIGRNYVLLKFTETRGGTELGMSLDLPACRLDGASFEKGEGKIHLEGTLKLDYVPVRMLADLDIASLEGEGQLVVEDS